MFSKDPNIILFLFSTFVFFFRCMHTWEKVPFTRKSVISATGGPSRPASSCKYLNSIDS